MESDEPHLRYQHVTLRTGTVADWAAAELAVAGLTEEDAAYLCFALGLKVAVLGSATAVVQTAKARLRNDLRVLQAALAAPEESNVGKWCTSTHAIYVAGTSYTGEHSDGAHGAMLRLSLMYLLEEAGFERLAEESLSAAPARRRPARLPCTARGSMCWLR